MRFYTSSVEETEALGRRLGRQLRPGAVVAYYGDLGSGKTAFTRGLAQGLGITARVTSPTYTIVNEYEGTVPLFHFDMYRLSSAEELFEIGWEDYLERGGVIAVEWSERVSEALEGALEIRFQKDAEMPDGRVITISGGKQYADLSL